MTRIINGFFVFKIRLYISNEMSYIRVGKSDTNVDIILVKFYIFLVENFVMNPLRIHVNIIYFELINPYNI